MNDNAAESLLPLKPDVFAILLALLQGRAHGYAIMQSARRHSTRRGQLQPGGMYRLLKRMLDEGLIEEVAPDATSRGADERRRYYLISSFGRKVAAAEARRMADLVAASPARQLLDEAESA